MAKVPYRRDRKRCIYCNAPEVTREHPWAIWIRRYVDFDEKSFFRGYDQVYPDREVLETPERWGGDPRHRPLSVVCGKCNSGWMSRVQQRAKEFMPTLFEGGEISLNRSKQEALAAWACMFATVTEHYWPNRTTISKRDRRLFKLSKTPPSTWRIWAGRHVRGDWRGHLMKCVRVLVPENFPRGREISPDRPNTQTVAFVTGELFVLAFSCPQPSFTAKIEPATMCVAGRKLRRIWPVDVDVIAWPPPVLNDAEAIELGNCIFEDIDRRSGWPTRNQRQRLVQPPVKPSQRYWPQGERP